MEKERRVWRDRRDMIEEREVWEGLEGEGRRREVGGVRRVVGRGGVGCEGLDEKPK